MGHMAFFMNLKKQKYESISNRRKWTNREKGNA